MSKLDPNLRITLVENLDDALDMREWLSERRDWLGVDIETEGVNLGKDKIRLFQIGDERRGFALNWEDWAGVIREVLPRYRQKIVLHNATFDLAFLRRDGVKIPEVLVHDTMIMAHLVNPAGRIGLKPLAVQHVGQEALLGQGELHEAMTKFGWTWATVPVDYPAYWHYGVLDTCLTACLADELFPQCDLYKDIYEIELACIHVLVNARLKGMAVDLDYTFGKRAELMSEMAEAEQFIPFAPSKDKAVREYFEHRASAGPLAGWWPFRTEKGDVSVDDDALAAFESQFPDVIPSLRKWRKSKFIVSHYLDSILEENQDGVLRCNIRQVLRTGRMSITDPALQTLPRGRAVRDAFVARPGTKILQADYKQAELRVFAWYAQCQPMIDAFKRGEDLHNWLAGHVYHEGNQSLVTKQQRQVSKNVQFARLYAAGNSKIALTAGVEVSVIDDFIDKYNMLFPEVQVFMKKLIDEMGRRKREEGTAYVKTRLGRRLVVDDDRLYTGLNYCVVPETPVLCGDFQWRPIGELDVGDSIVGFDEEPVGKKTRRFSGGSVESVSRIILPCVEVNTSRGALVCSTDHRVLVRMRNKHGTHSHHWRTAGALKVGDEVLFFSEPWEPECTWEAGWIAGQFDGEGCLSVRQTNAQYAQNAGPQFDLMVKLLRDRGFDPNVYDVTDRMRSAVITTLPEVARLLGTVRPQRFLNNPKVNDLWRNRTVRGFWDMAYVASVEPLGEREVVSMQTSTRTYISNGMLSHNCVQGTATGDILKLKLVELDAAGVGEYIRLPVHDEILFEVPDEEMDEVRRVVKRVMPEKELFGDCVLEIDTDVVSSWGEHYG